MTVRSWLRVSLAVAMWSGCASAGSSDDSNVGTGDTDTMEVQDAGVVGLDSATTADSGTADSGTNPPTPPAEVEHSVYAHSSSTLYRLDPDTLEVVSIGAFAGCTEVTDIAVDAESNIFGVTFTGLYRIDRETAVCTEIVQGSFPNSLSFIPAGVLDPHSEVLVAYDMGTYIRIDSSTGTIRTIGTIGGDFTSSGDIVSVENGGTYLTADGPGCDDCLLEVNPRNGALVKNFGAIGLSTVYGLAYWGGKAYGFDETGIAFSIQFTLGGITTTTIAIPQAPVGLSFWGAGSSTRAPIIQ